jgi:hypothetical protein
MDTKTLVSFPPLPKLEVLYRPPLRHTYLTFTSNGYYASTHSHDTCLYQTACPVCRSWCQQVNSSEECSVRELARVFPSLREVLIPRFVFQDLGLITGLPSESILLPTQSNQNEEELDWLEHTRRMLNVAIWFIEDLDHKCDICNSSQSDSDPTNAKNNQIRVVQHPQNRECSRTHRNKVSSSGWSSYPKFWWSNTEIRLTKCVRGGSMESPSRRLSRHSAHAMNARLRTPWDL